MPYKEFEIDGIGKVKVYKRRGNRSLRLTVAADGNIRVTMPLWAPYQAGLAFTRSRKAWILTQNKQEDSLLAHGQQVGKTHRLQFVQHQKLESIRTSVHRNDIYVAYGAEHSITSPVVQDAARAACWRALKSQSTKLITPRLNELAAQHGFTYRSVNVKRMTSRWGSCDQSGNIVFSLFLIQLPWEFIDYVILHELTHTRELNHGPDFWRQMETILPGARKRRQAMKAYRPVLMVVYDSEAMA